MLWWEWGCDTKGAVCTTPEADSGCLPIAWVTRLADSATVSFGKTAVVSSPEIMYNGNQPWLCAVHQVLCVILGGVIPPCYGWRNWGTASLIIFLMSHSYDVHLILKMCSETLPITASTHLWKGMLSPGGMPLHLCRKPSQAKGVAWNQFVYHPESYLTYSFLH